MMYIKLHPQKTVFILRAQFEMYKGLLCKNSEYVYASTHTHTVNVREERRKEKERDKERGLIARSILSFV